MKKCLTCHEEIPKERLQAKPDAEYCVEHQPDTRLQGIMTWEHKTAPTIVIGSEEDLADLRRYQRRGVHAQLPMTSKGGSTVASAALLGKFEELRGRTRDGEKQDVVMEKTNVQMARCHPDRPAVSGAYGKCFECSLEWYRKRKVGTKSHESR